MPEPGGERNWLVVEAPSTLVIVEDRFEYEDGGALGRDRVPDGVLARRLRVDRVERVPQVAEVHEGRLTGAGDARPLRPVDELRANEAYAAWTEERVAAGGNRVGGPPKPFTPPPVPEGVMNKTDHDSRMMRTESAHGAGLQRSGRRDSRSDHRRCGDRSGEPRLRSS